MCVDVLPSFVQGHFAPSCVLGAVLFLRAFFFRLLVLESVSFSCFFCSREISCVCSALSCFCKHCVEAYCCSDELRFFIIGGLVTVHRLAFFFSFLAVFFLLRCLTRIKCFFFVAFVYYSQFTVSRLARERGKVESRRTQSWDAHARLRERRFCFRTFVAATKEHCMEGCVFL